MIKGIVRNARELWEIPEMTDKMCVAWGGGKIGYLFIREVRIHKIQNVYIYDSNEKNMADVEERIFIDEIKGKIDKIFFVITIAEDRIVNEIANQILRLGGRLIYRYVPADRIYVSDKLNKTGFYNGIKYQRTLSGSDAKKIMEQKILDKKPFLFARWGQVEGNIVYGDRVGMLTDLEIHAAQNNAGFYPLDRISIRKFAEIYANSAREIDVLCAGCWFTKIEECYEWYSPSAVLVSSDMKNPFWKETSWTSALKGKTVLVIHPFAKLIEKQYLKRECLFNTQDILPEMNLKTYRAVQSMGEIRSFRHGLKHWKKWRMIYRKWSLMLLSLDAVRMVCH